MNSQPYFKCLLSQWLIFRGSSQLTQLCHNIDRLSCTVTLSGRSFPLHNVILAQVHPSLALLVSTASNFAKQSKQVCIMLLAKKCRRERFPRAIQVAPTLKGESALNFKWTNPGPLPTFRIRIFWSINWTSSPFWPWHILETIHFVCSVLEMSHAGETMYWSVFLRNSTYGKFWKCRNESTPSCRFLTTNTREGECRTVVGLSPLTRQHQHQKELPRMMRAWRGMHLRVLKSF